MSEYLLSVKIELFEEGGYFATSDDFLEFLARRERFRNTGNSPGRGEKDREVILWSGGPFPDALKTGLPAGVALEAKVPVWVGHDSIAGHEIEEIIQAIQL